MTKREKIIGAINLALADENARASRVRLCEISGPNMAQCGEILWTSSYVLRDKPLQGLSLLTEVGAELILAASQLYKDHHWYAGAALVRQLVEVEYLMWLFAQDKGEPERWLNSTPAELRDQFKPSELRKQSKGVFRSSEYSAHCDLGGHPNPKARILLKSHSSPFKSHEHPWIDLAQHVSRLWPSFLEALSLQKNSDVLPSHLLQEIEDAITDWTSNERPEVGSIELLRRGPAILIS